MKIAFWSNSKESIGVTSNLACISVASVLGYSYKSVLIENHYQKNRLENVLMYNRSSNKLREEVKYQYQRAGMHYIMNHLYTTNLEIKTSKLMEEVTKLIKKGSIEILNNSLYYIPTSNEINSETFDHNLYGHINRILEVLDIFADITYIDTSNYNNLSSKIILDEVDLVVVNFVQNSSMIKHFFKNYSSIVSKCVFLISSYHQESSLSINKIMKTHLIDKAYIASIPYNVDYQEAVLQGTIVEFLSRNYNCKRSNPNYNFIQAVKKAAYMIMTNVELLNQKEECL